MDRFVSVRADRVQPGAVSVAALCLVMIASLSTATSVWAQDQYEPNDTSQTAFQVVQSGTTLGPTISAPSDVDWFYFQHARAGFVSVAMTSIPVGSDYDMKIHFYDSSQQDLVEVGLSDEPDNSDELLQGEVGAGDYFVEIFPYEGFNASDGYQLSFTFEQGTTNTPPVVTILQPAGGEQYEAGTQQTLQYTIFDADGQSPQVTVEHSTNNGTAWQQLSSGAQQSGTYSLNWNVPNFAYSQGRIRVTADDGSGPVTALSNTFAVTEVSSGNNSVAVGSNSGTAGSSATVSVALTNEDIVKGLQMDLTFDPAVLSFVDASPISRAASFSDSSRTVSSGRARVVLFPTGSQTLAAGSGSILNLTFDLLAAGVSSVDPTGVLLSGENGNSLNVTATQGSITVTGSGGGPPQIQLVSPTGGETFAGGSVATIQYVASGGSGPLSVEVAYSSNNGGSYQVQGTDSGNSGSFSWAVPNVATSQGKIRVTASDNVNTPASDESGAFTITASSGGNTVAIGSGEGGGGIPVTVPLSLTNDREVKALQFDLTYDEAVVAFSSASSSGRGSSMVTTIQRIGTGRARGVLRFEDGSVLSAGSGEVASVVFSLVGGQGTQSVITPTAILLSDPDANEIPGATGQSGVITVTSDPAGAPEVHVSVLQNPGRPRHLFVFVAVDGGSGSAPEVSVGGQVLTPVAVPSAAGVYRTSFFAPESATSLTVSASDSVGEAVGSDSKTVTF